MLKTNKVGPVLRLTLDRPEVRNAFNDELIAALHDQFEKLPDDVRVVVISGLGPAFCAGGDLEWMRRASHYTEEQNYEDALKLARMLESVHGCAAVTIAKVHGAAFGGGCGLVCAVDYAVVAESTKFCFSEVKLGLVPATISPFVLNKVTKGVANALFVSADVFDGPTALRIGLANRCVPDGDLEAETEKLVAQILRNGPQAIAATKRLLSLPSPSLEDCASALARARAGDEGRHGVASFLDKRTADFVVEPA
jgi:enoyl-CoA hydratase/carnithine racemase